MVVDEILGLIISDPVKALLAIEGLKKAGKLTKELFKNYSSAFQERQKFKKFGCTPSDLLVKKLLKIDDTPSFICLKAMLVKHPTLKLARVGLYLEKLSIEGKTKELHETRNEVEYEIKDNHGDVGETFLNLASSGILSDLIKNLDNLQKNENLTKEEITRKYEYSVKKLDEITIWISNRDVKANIYLRIKNKLTQLRPDIFMCISAGNATKNAMLVIAKMTSRNTLRKHGYICFSPQISRNNPSKKQYLWTFYRFV